MARSDDIPHEPSAERRLARRRRPITGDVVPVRPRDGAEIDDGPSPEDLARFSGVTQTCPECGAELHDDVEICWSCGHALTDRSANRPSVWALAVAILALIAFLLAITL